MIFPWLVQLVVAIALNVLAVVLTPRPKGPKPEAVQQAESPTASADRPIPVLFGTALMSETNVIGAWDKGTRQYQVNV
jgi:hypothetical protein